MPSLWKIFITFFKIGLFTFGGGGVLIAWIENELVQQKKWLSDEDFLDYYAISQCTPGIIAVNVATLVGYHVRQKIGATVATIAVILPSVLVITLIAVFMQDLVKNETVVHAFNGIRASVIAVIIGVVMQMLRKNIKNPIAMIIFATAFLLLIIFNISPFLMILFGCIAGLVYQKFTHIREMKK